LILEAQNKLSLNDTLDKYFDANVLDGLHVYKGTDYSRRLTISNLLFQTSGIPDWFEEGGAKKLLIENDIFLSFEEKLASIKKIKPYFAPGARTRYSDTNFVLLVKIVENITKMTMAEVCREWIFKPLNMQKTYLPIGEKDFVTNVFYRNKSMYRPNTLRCASESGDAITTARELMIFLKAFFNGTFFDKNVFTKLSKYGKLQITMGPTYYGGGYMQIPLNSLMTLFMGKGELLDHCGATGSVAFYYPEKDLYFVGDVNQLANPGAPIRLVMRLAMTLK
jgi:CubicO group peptidase (beta-lactamase class C family)